jgi:clan AA aspartic protease (TIGR02281 family)
MQRHGVSMSPNKRKKIAIFLPPWPRQFLRFGLGTMGAIGLSQSGVNAQPPLSAAAPVATPIISTVASTVAARSTTAPCYMVTSSGQQLNLGQLCGEENVPRPTLKPTTFRVKIKKRLASTPVIEVNFNGQTFEMIVDTGASSTLITQSMAQALRIQPTGYREVIVANGATLKFPISSINSVSAGGLTAKNLEVTIADQADVGLLGHDFFGNYDIKIKRNVIEFSPASE